MNDRVCVFTIVSRNYLHYAINLMNSVAEHLPQARRVVALCDRSAELDLSAQPFEVIELETLEIPHLDRLLYQYTILELNTAIKPFVCTRLFADATVDKVIYFDPDMQLFASGEPLLQALAANDVVLTPHLTDFLDDDRHPSDLSILQSGTYNLGFIALRRSEAAQRLLQWWCKKLLRDCVVDIARGLFTDQKWMDLIPGMFAAVRIERHPGWNVAYWNLAHRKVEKRDGVFLVNGQPLFFFHFSGYSSGTGSISKHQDRFALKDLPDAAQRLFELYARNVAACGLQRYAPLPYAYARLHSGTPLADIGRVALRCQLDWDAPLPDLRTAAGERFIIDFLNAPVDGEYPPISRLALTCHTRRADLQAAFPDVLRADRTAFVEWFKLSARSELQLDAAFMPVAPAGPLAPQTPSMAAAPELPSTLPTPSPTPSPTLRNRLYRAAYRLAWPLRGYVRPLVSSRTRQRVSKYLLRRAFEVARAPAATGAPAAAVTAVSERHPFGVNLIGYVRAESGVGESSRATLRCLEAADVPHSIIDFRAGNLSRMGESIDETRQQGLRYGINLFHINADQIDLAAEALGADYFAGRYRIGYWAWELERFPEEWVSAFRRLDEIWVPSTFCQRAIAAKSPLPVVCIPHSISMGRMAQPARQRFGLRPDSTVFLAMADMLSVSERKNPLGAVEAFARAFPGADLQAELVVKLSNADSHPGALKRMRELAASCRGIHFIDSYLERQDLHALIDSVDCFVSLHRSEGFGLGMAEAMARGKVVVATAWSGNMDFMHAANSLLVAYRLTELDRDYGPYRQGEVWADPDIDDAAAKMRAVATDPLLRQRLGQRARADCERFLAPAAIGRHIAERLARINAGS